MEYIFVHFDENDVRDVIANGDVLGRSENTLMLAAGYYEITLSGVGFQPRKWEGAIAATDPAAPLGLLFTRKTSR
jgi:hypothetical protein